MATSPRDSSDDLLVSADVLGSFGVTPADVRRGPSGEDALESALADAFATPVDRTTVLRRTITRSDRGLACAARYSRSDLERELVAVFEAIGWSLSVSTAREFDGLELSATDPRGRNRQAAVSFPDTPLAGDNLPAVLWTVNDEILAETDARFVLLSSGVDRWRAALVDAAELERLRDRYGPRIEAFDRPLLPAHGLAAYVPAAGDEETGERGDDASADGEDPWPPWALEGDARRSTDSPADVGAFIDEAEPSARSEPAETAASDGGSGAATAVPASAGTAEGSTASAPSSEVDGFELRGTATTTRQRNGDADPSAESDSGGAESGDPGRTDGSRRGDRTGDANDDATDTDGFGTLSGTCETARVTNDSFGTDLGRQSEDDRYRALGAALDAGGNVSVRGLLEDDDFLPELPAAGSEETRIEFEDGCAPVEVPDAAAAAERSGFEWVDAGSLETTRVSSGSGSR